MTNEKCLTCRYNEGELNKILDCIIKEIDEEIHFHNFDVGMGLGIARDIIMKKRYPEEK